MTTINRQTIITLAYENGLYHDVVRTHLDGLESFALEIARISIEAERNAACAQQSAQSQQDALDGPRYRWLRDRSSTRDGMTDCQAVARLVGFTQFPTLTMESRLHDPDSAIDALIATQGASNV